MDIKNGLLKVEEALELIQMNRKARKETTQRLLQELETSPSAMGVTEGTPTGGQKRAIGINTSPNLGSEGQASRQPADKKKKGNVDPGGWSEERREKDKAGSNSQQRKR